MGSFARLGFRADRGTRVTAVPRAPRHRSADPLSLSLSLPLLLSLSSFSPSGEKSARSSLCGFTRIYVHIYIYIKFFFLVLSLSPPPEIISHRDRRSENHLACALSCVIPSELERSYGGDSSLVQSGVVRIHIYIYIGRLNQ